jgi:hypothetical protein
MVTPGWFYLAQEVWALFKMVFDKQLLPDGPSQGLKPNPLCILYGPTKVMP